MGWISFLKSTCFSAASAREAIAIPQTPARTRPSPTRPTTSLPVIPSPTFHYGAGFGPAPGKVQAQRPHHNPPTRAHHKRPAIGPGHSTAGVQATSIAWADWSGGRRTPDNTDGHTIRGGGCAYGSKQEAETTEGQAIADGPGAGSPAKDPGTASVAGGPAGGRFGRGLLLRRPIRPAQRRLPQPAAHHRAEEPPAVDERFPGRADRGPGPPDRPALDVRPPTTGGNDADAAIQPVDPHRARSAAGVHQQAGRHP